MIRLCNFLRHSNIHFRTFSYFVTCFLGVTVSLLCRLQAVSKIHIPIYPYLISEGRRNCSKNRDSQEAHYQILKYTKMNVQISQKILRIVALKLLELTRFFSSNLSIHFNFVRCWGSVVMFTFLK